MVSVKAAPVMHLGSIASQTSCSAPSSCFYFPDFTLKFSRISLMSLSFILEFTPVKSERLRKRRRKKEQVEDKVVRNENLSTSPC